MRYPLALLLLAVLALGACGGSHRSSASVDATRTVTTTRVEVVHDSSGGRFDAPAIYARDAPGVVTVISTFPGGALSLLSGSRTQTALGSGFVLSASGEIATNAHVVATQQPSGLQLARAVYVKFADGNEVSARVIGADPNSDVALIRVDPHGLRLQPIALGSSAHLTVGDPVAAIGSPFGEPQSLSVGVISGTNRSIDSLNGGGTRGGGFAISGAIQTDAAINHGNSGGPLVGADGRVIGINSQIESTGGGGEGVGFAVPIDTVRRSLAQLRTHGTAGYGYLGVSAVPVYPQLAARFHLAVTKGAWIQQLNPGSPAAAAHLRAGHGRTVFQAQPYATGGDVIAAVDGHPLTQDVQLSDLIAPLQPGRTVRLLVYRGSKRILVEVKLGQRPGTRPATR